MKQVLDSASGSKMFWFEKEHPDVFYGDLRQEAHILCDGRALNIDPDGILDFKALPFRESSFNLVVFDPPHLKIAGEKSWMKKKYGRLNPETWREDLRLGFIECWRVLSCGGTMIFKWNETQIKISEILKIIPISPFFGHTTTQSLKTHWMVFYKSVDNLVMMLQQNKQIPHMVIPVIEAYGEISLPFFYVFKVRTGYIYIVNYWESFHSLSLLFRALRVALLFPCEFWMLSLHMPFKILEGTVATRTNAG